MTEAPASIAHLALDALPHGAAVLDADRVVLATNSRWRERRAAGAPAHPPVGERYPGADADAEFVDGVEAVLAGEREDHAGVLEGERVRVRGFARGERRHAVVTTGVAAPGAWPVPAGELLDAAGDPVRLYDDRTGQVHLNRAAAATYGVDGRSFERGGSTHRRLRERVGAESLADYDEALEAVLSGAADRRRVETEVATEEGAMVTDSLITPVVVGGRRRGALVVDRDATAYRRELRELEQRRDARETLYRINAIVQDLVGGLVEETRREDIEAAVVEELDRSELYRFAAIGRHHPARDALFEFAAAGIDETTADELGRSLLADHAALLRTGEVRAVGIDDEALATLLGTDVVVVPLTYGNSVYGLLLVGLGRGRLTERELAAFEVLGDVVGFAISATRHRRLVLADLLTELEFRVDGGGLLAGLSADLGCELAVDSVVPRDEDSQLQYLTVEGADAEALAAAAEEREAVAAARVIDAGDPGRVELTATGDSVLLSLGRQDADVRDATAREGTARVTAAIAADENARAVVEAVSAAVPATELVGKRDVERTPDDRRAVDAATVGDLTDRQLAALETAYRAGYFDSPRDSTAEEVADAMDISSPTLHQHLQAAHRKLLAGIFQEEGRPEPRQQ